MEPHEEDALMLYNLQKMNDLFMGYVLVPAYLVTMTICYKTTFKCINVEVLCEKFKLGSFICDAKVSELKQFKNSIIMKIEENGQKMSVKVFTNGVVHFTGVKQFVDAYIVLQRINSVLVIMFDDHVKILSRSIQMMNVCFKLNKIFHMDNTFSNMSNAANNYCITYDKTRHAAIKIKNDFSTIMLFKSGSVLISGCKEISGVEESAKILASLVNLSE